MLSFQNAFNIAKKFHNGLTAVDILDFGNAFGFIFVKWDRDKMGEPTPEAIQDNFQINGYFLVNKTTGKTSDLPAAYNFDKIERAKRLPIPK